MKNHVWKIVLGVVVVILVASVVYSQQKLKEANEGVVIEQHIKGNTDADVVLVEYSDFECPACGQFYPFVKEIVEDYSDSLRFEYKHFPLISIHALAVPAARAAEAAAQQDSFFEMHDILFERQTEWSKSANPKAFFIKYAEEIGLDTDQFKLQMESTLIDDAVNSSFSEARDKGITGTPTFFLNGEQMEFSTYDEFRNQIETALGVDRSGDTL